jgi:hypothetical protein
LVKSDTLYGTEGVLSKNDISFESSGERLQSLYSSVSTNNYCHMITIYELYKKIPFCFLCPHVANHVPFFLDSGQHVALHDTDPEPGVIGLINAKLSPMAVARIASEDARAICMREYGSAPDVDIYGDPDFTFP